MRNVLEHRTGIARSSSLTIALLAGSCLSAGAQEIGDTAAGQRLAENWCSGCHVVSVTSQRSTSTGAPSFAAIAHMKSTTPMALKAFLQTSHGRMPDLHLNS